ncbi:MAG: hypothetical protein ACPGL0_09070 [Limisphaerales bacterium]
MKAFSAPNILTTLYAVRMGLVEVFHEIGVAIFIHILMKVESGAGTFPKTTLPIIGHAMPLPHPGWHCWHVLIKKTGNTSLTFVAHLGWPI